LAINQVLRLYVERGRSQDAILLYERLMEDTLPLEGPVDPPLFRWPQLNFLAELYMEVGEYERALLTIKRGARRLQLRGLQIVWETRKDDSEYDEHPLPVDLRTKLGICRLMMGDITLAKVMSTSVSMLYANDED
jgi:general transcription factor 3C polypeptide 3 (transcription factor C subunit 4)